MATTDPLTGCINRREFQDRINKIKERTNGALLMLDLDNFKKINDTYGHDAGDAVIQDFSRCIQMQTREDDWVVRFGGEEFVVWLPNIVAVDAIRIAERVRECVESSEIVSGSSTIKYTVSIGLNVVRNEPPSRFENWITHQQTSYFTAQKTRDATGLFVVLANSRTTLHHSLDSTGIENIYSAVRASLF